VRNSNFGFTIIELMVAVAIVILLAALALPSFEGVRQRAVTRGAADQLLSFWNQARLESARRNQLVKVGVLQSSSGANICLGAAITTDLADNTPCNCFAENPGTDACDVARYPTDNSEWRGVKLSGVTLGESDWPTVAALKPVIIESKRTALTRPVEAGTVTIDGPPGNRAYKLRLNIDQFGRGVLCEPTSAIDKLSDYHNQRCSP